MRHLFPLITVLGVATLAVAQEARTDRVIAVSGTATVYAKPDTARIHYGIRVTEPSADALKDVLGKTGKAIDEAGKKLKLSGLVVTAAPMGIKQGGGNNNNLPVPVAPGAPAAAPGLGTLTGYVSYTATIVNADPEKLRTDVEAFVKAITEAGANTSGGEPKDFNLNVFPGQDGSDGPKVVLTRSDDTAAREDALQTAVKKAVKSAQAIARGLGVDPATVKVVSVTDVEPEKPAAEPLSVYAMFDGAASAPKTNAGEVEVKVRVVVKCSY
jgi:uncharacterized protein YggE